MNPSSTVFASVIIISATTVLRRMRQNTLQSHFIEIVVFGFMLLIALLTLAIVAPTFAKTLGYLGIVGAFILNGPEVFKLAGDFGRGKGAV